MQNSDSLKICVTYARTHGVFSPDLVKLKDAGCTSIRIIAKNRELAELRDRIIEVRQFIDENELDIRISLDLLGNRPVVAEGSPKPLRPGDLFEISNGDSGSPNRAWKYLQSISLMGWPSESRISDLAAGTSGHVCAAANAFRIVDQDSDTDSVLAEALVPLRFTEGKAIGVRASVAENFSALNSLDRRLIEDDDIRELVDEVFISFCRRAEEVEVVKEASAGAFLVVAKVETNLKEDALHDIASVADSMLFGRTDASLFLTPREMLELQSKCIDVAAHHRKQLAIGSGILANTTAGPSMRIAEAMDVAHLIGRGVSNFLINGEPARTNPIPSMQGLKELWSEIRE